MQPSASRVRYADLEGIQIQTGDAPRALVVTLHGYGAPGDDLVPIAGEWIQRLGPVAEQVRFVFPTAPLSLEDQGIPGGRAWWALNMQRLLDAVEASDISELRSHEPPGIEDARQKCVDAIAAMLADAGLTESQLVLGGFSQGAMLSMDLATRGLPQSPAGLFLYSGTLICESAWQAGAPRLVNTQVVQSHGSMDPILPFQGAEALYELMKVAGVPVEFIPFTGAHTLTLDAIDATATIVQKLLTDG